MSKILTVFGSTGQQGGSVINSVQAHPTLSKEYKIRGVTRDPSKPAAQKLISKGAEVVQVCFAQNKILLVADKSLRRTLEIKIQFVRRLKGPMLYLESRIVGLQLK